MRLLLAALALLLRFALPFGVLAGCGGGEEGPVVVRIWHQKDSGERDFLEEWVERFNASQDSIRIETLYKETEELRNHYVFAAVGRRGPDLVYGPADNVGTFGITETIRPLDGLLPDTFLAGFDESGLLRWDGRLVGVADQVGNHLTFVYNRELIPEPPQTLDELIAIGQRLTRDENGDGRPDHYGLAWNYTEPFFFIPFLTAFGGWVMDAEGNPTLDTPATVQAIQFILDLRDRYRIIPGEADYETVKMLFTDGAAAAVIDGPWSWAGYGENGVDYMLAPIPFNTATGRWPQPMAAAKVYSVNPAVSEERLPAVLTVLRYLTGEEIQRAMAERLSTIPVQRSVRESPVMAENPYLAASLRQVEHTLPMPTAPQMRQIWDAMRGPYQLVMNGAVTPQQAARMMQEAAEKRIADTFLD
ncbi:MAG TPA: extracellular solute-binding protein [Rubricoccaceae bacterium]|nr:extracellular solute-binding protein [Rubricoccaceae bacterium]